MLPRFLNGGATCNEALRWRLSARDVLVALASSLLTLAAVMCADAHPTATAATASTAFLEFGRALSIAGNTPRMHAKLPVGGVSSLLKDLGCGISNGKSTPLNLRRNGFGLNRTMVDIGLYDGADTVSAVKAGFRVYGFEPVLKHMKHVKAAFARAGLAEGTDYQSVTLDPSGRLTTSLLPPQPGRGIAYLFLAAAGPAHDYRNITQDSVGSSLVDPYMRQAKPLERVQIVPVSDYVHEDVYYFKCDTQGFDKDALTGALPLFRNHHVRLVLTELYLQGLEGAGTSADELLDLLTERLGFVCFSSMRANNAPHHLPAGHPEARGAFLEQIRAYQQKIPSGHRWGFFDDLTCINPRMAAGRG